MDAEIQPSVRADKWLWAVRIFKTRGDAATACRLNQVTILGQPVKPSRCVRANEILVVEKAPVTRTLRVKEVLEKRMGAKVVESFLEDLTLPEVWEKAREAEAQNRQNEDVPRRGIAGRSRPLNQVRNRRSSGYFASADGSTTYFPRHSPITPTTKFSSESAFPFTLDAPRRERSLCD